MSLMHGLAHTEIPAPDLEKTASFYETVFGWKVMRNIPFEGYWLFSYPNADEQAAGGGFDSQRKPAPEKTGVQIIIECKIDETLPKIEAAGGKIVRGKDQISPDHGYDAYFVDPVGNYMGLHEGA